jgi:hypothetical protein
MESDPGDEKLVERVARAIRSSIQYEVEPDVRANQMTDEETATVARAALAVARPMIREECAKVAEADAKKSGWLVAAQLGLTEDEQKQFNQNAAKALEIAAAIRAMD